MADFQPAFDFMAPHEWRNDDPDGGYTNDHDDPGGETKWGIAKRYHPSVDIKNLTREQAAQIYKDDYWMYEKIKSQAVASKLFDMTVNPGKSTAIELVQHACCDAGYPTTVDGGLGPNTLDAINKCNPTTLMGYMVSRLKSYYRFKVVEKPTKAKFINGWLVRAEDVPA